MEMMMDYAIVWGRDADELHKKVQNKLDLGWTPCGGVAFDSRSGEMYQAMTSTAESRREAARSRDY
jgi:hypothetical protein